MMNQVINFHPDIAVNSVGLCFRPDKNTLTSRAPAPLSHSWSPSRCPLFKSLPQSQSQTATTRKGRDGRYGRHKPPHLVGAWGRAERVEAVRDCEGVCWDLKVIGYSNLREVGGELDTLKTLTYGSNYFCTKHKLDHANYMCNYGYSSVKLSSQKSFVNL